MSWQRLHRQQEEMLCCKHIQIAFTRKILRVGSVFSSDGENRAAAEFPLHSVCIHEDFSFQSQTSI